MYISTELSTAGTVGGADSLPGSTGVLGWSTQKQMTNPMTKQRTASGRPLSLSSKATAVPDRAGSSKGSRTSTDKYAFSTAGPAVSEVGAKIVGKSLNSATRHSAAQSTLTTRPVIATNVQPVNHITNENSLSDITSAADQFNSYRFDETSALRTYKKMMTLHLKDEMFRKLKFITGDDLLDFSRQPNSICSYVCTNMRVSNYQWSDYWNMVKKTTKKMIENQRTNATSAIKKGFKSKYKLNVV